MIPPVLKESRDLRRRFGQSLKFNSNLATQVGGGSPLLPPRRPDQSHDRLGNMGRQGRPTGEQFAKCRVNADRGVGT